MAITTILSEQAVVESYQEIQRLAWFPTEIPHSLIIQLLLCNVYDSHQFSRVKSTIGEISGVDCYFALKINL